MRHPWIPLIPALALIFLVLIYPLIYAVYISFFKYDLISGVQVPVGLRNYEQILFGDDVFYKSLSETLIFAVSKVSLVTILALGAALLLNEKFKGRRIVLICLLLPWAVPAIVNGVIWSWILNASYGLLNGALTSLGLITSYYPWLGYPETAMAAIVLAEVWRSLPFMTLLILAGLQNMRKDLHEAAQLDGASLYQRFRYVTFPQIRAVVLIALILQTMWVFQVFDVIYVTTGGGPQNSTLLLIYYAFKQSFEYLHIGYGAALGSIITLIVLALTLIYLAIASRIRE